MTGPQAILVTCVNRQAMWLSESICRATSRTAKIDPCKSPFTVLNGEIPFFLFLTTQLPRLRVALYYDLSVPLYLSEMNSSNSLEFVVLSSLSLIVLDGFGYACPF